MLRQKFAVTQEAVSRQAVLHRDMVVVRQKFAATQCGGDQYVIPKFDVVGNLPPGIHWASWREFKKRFGVNDHRQKLLKGLQLAFASLRVAGCCVVYIDGSFVTAKELPNDFDACWSSEGVNPDLLDPVLLDFSDERAAQKAKFGGELFPAELIEDASGRLFLDFFQLDRRTEKPKGIVGLWLKKKVKRE